MKGTGKWLKIIVPTIFLAFLLIFPLGLEAKEVKTVLILNSYHRGFAWSDDLTQGIMEGLAESPFKTNVYTEYLDWKNYPTQENMQNFYQMIKYKYGKKKLDLIITSDNAATYFALEHRKEIFPKTPIVFCGLYRDLALKLFWEKKNITGVVEDIDNEGTIRTALKIYPQTKNIYVIHERTESGFESLDAIKKVAAKIDDSLKVKSIDSISFADPSSCPASLPKNSVVLLTTLFRDKDGRTDSAENIAQMLSKKMPLPIFYFYEMGFGHGILGGNLLSPKVHGQETAKIALKILEGEKASSLVPYQGHDRLVAFDYNVLKRFNIPVASLPEKSKIINRPVSFYERHTKLVCSIIVIFVLLVSFICALLFNIHKRKKAEFLLKANFDELSALYEELAATEETLRNQYGELERSKKQIEENGERYKLVFEASNEGLWDYDCATGKFYFSDKWYKNYGFSSTESIGLKRIFGLVHPDDQKKATRAFHDIREGIIDHYEIEVRIQDRDKQYKWILAKGIGLWNKGKLVRLAGSHQDIHLKKSQEEKIRQLAYYDAVTGLPNRTSFYEWLDKKLADKDYQGGAILFVDLDNFKMVNDTFGHVLGDKLLRQVGERLKNIQDNNNTLVARLGGDEFVVAIHSLSGSEKINSYCTNLLGIFADSVIIDDNELAISASIGVALYPNDGQTVNDLLKKADLAMYKAKNLGKNNFALFDEVIEEELYLKVVLTSKLRGAVDRGEFELYYQPQLDMKTKKIHGFEALIRWMLPEYGLIPPWKFIGLAEETGQINTIGEWVLKEVCLFAVEINKDREDKLVAWVNISSVQLMQRDFVDIVRSVLEKTNMQPFLLGLEITESILMESFESNSRKLEILKELGIQVSLDDFGTGYSSLNYLRQLPINMLKIDKSFTNDILDDEKVGYLTQSIVNIAHQIGLEVVAEGIETVEQLNLLQEYKCDLAQGYLIGKPVPEQEFREFLTKYS